MRNLYWLFSDRVIKVPITLLISSLLARYLGPEYLGLIVFAISFYGIFNFLVNTGLEEIVTRSLVESPEQEKEILGSGMMLKFLGGLFSTIICITSGYLFYAGEVEFWLISLVSLSVLFYFPFILESYFQSRYESKYIIRIGFIIFGFSSILKLIGIYFELSYIYFLALNPIDIFLTATSYIYLSRVRSISFFSWRIDKSKVFSILKDSIPLIISAFAVTLYMKMDQIMIKSMIGNSDLGIFSVGIRFVENLYFIPMLITSSFLPMLVEEKKKSEVEFQKSVYVLMSATLYVCITISLLLFFFSDLLIPLFFGEKFLKSIDILKIYSFTLIFTALGVSSSRWLLVENRQHLALFRTISGLVLNLILNYIWIPKYGNIGASWSSLISNGFASFLFYGLMPSTFSIFKMQCYSFNPIPLITYYKKKSLGSK